MKRLFTFAVALLLVGGLLLGASAANESGETTVSWTENGVWLTLTVHNGVDLGKINSPIDVLEDISDNQVTVETNNPAGFILTVKALDFKTPDGFEGNLLADFYWKVAQAPHGKQFHDIQKNYVSFPGLKEQMTVGVSDKQGSATFGMGYKYTADEQDIPGDYSITLEYTATSQ